MKKNKKKMGEKSEVLEAMLKETMNCVWFISFWFDGIEFYECRKTYPLKRFLRI